MNEASGITSRPRHTFNVEIADRVDALSEDDRKGPGRLLQGGRGGTDTGQDHIWAERDQFDGIFVQARKIARAPARIDTHIVADLPTCPLQPLQECREPGLHLWLVRTYVHEHADSPHPLRLLAACGERPSRS